MNLYKFHNKPEELNGYEDRIYYLPNLALNALEGNPKREDKSRLEDAIAKGASSSFFYAYRVLNEPWPKGEDAIAKDGYYSGQYAEAVIKGPWPKGEDAIAKRGSVSYFYAKEVLKGPFPKGEKAIFKDSYFNERYRRFLESLK